MRPLGPWAIATIAIQLAASGFSPFALPLAAFFTVLFPAELWERLYSANTAWTFTAFWMPAIAFVTYWLNGLLLLSLEAFVPELLDQFRVQPGKRFDMKVIGKVIKNLLIGQVFVILPYGIGCAELGRFTPFYVVSRPELPTHREMFLGMLFAVLFNEVVFYYGHRLLHSKICGVNLYTLIHKVHHEFSAPIGLVASYCHPVEMLISNALPLTFGGLIIHQHPYTLMQWIVFAVLGTQFHHSGLRLPWVPGLEMQPEYHDFHHKVFISNYGALGWLDRLHNTDKLYREAIAAGSVRRPAPFHVSRVIPGGLAVAFVCTLCGSFAG